MTRSAIQSKATNHVKGLPFFAPVMKATYILIRDMHAVCLSQDIYLFGGMIQSPDGKISSTNEIHKLSLGKCRYMLNSFMKKQSHTFSVNIWKRCEGACTMFYSEIADVNPVQHHVKKYWRKVKNKTTSLTREKSPKKLIIWKNIYLERIKTCALHEKSYNNYIYKWIVWKSEVSCEVSKIHV